MKFTRRGIIAITALLMALCITTSGCSTLGRLSVPESSSQTAQSSVQSQASEPSQSAADSQSGESDSTPASEPSAQQSSAATSASAVVSTNGGTSTASRPGIGDVVEAISDSVVAINVTGVAYDYFNRSYPTEGSGSGVILSADGYIVTNNHVVTGGTSITVFLQDGRSFPAKLIGKSSENDVALLKIDATGLVAATVGKSSTLRVGDATIVIGNPLGELQGTVTTGIISGLEREITISEGTTMKLLQTDAAVNPGNSGGGLFDYNGELIGIVVAKTSDTDVEGLGFVIPIDDVLPVVSELKQYGYITGRPYIGLVSIDIASSLAAHLNDVAYTGVYVQSTAAGGPAEQGGLRSVDLILQIDGTAIENTSQVESIIASKKIGDTVKFYVFRRSSGSATQGEYLELTVTVGENKS